MQGSLREELKSRSKTHYIRVAGMLSLVTNAILALAKLVTAYFSSSLALLGDGLDSLTDVLIALATLVTSSVISRAEDKEHPWGHERAETVTTLVLSFIIFFAGSQVIVQCAKRIFEVLTQEKIILQEIKKEAIIVSIISISGKSLLALAQYHYAKLSSSPMILANAWNMKSDILLSLAVLIGLVLSKIFKMPLLDPLVALLVGIWIVKNAISLFFKMNFELMDGNKDDSLYKKVFEACLSVEGVQNPHKARIRKMASHFDIDLDIEVDPLLSVYDAHEKAERVEEAIRALIPEAYDVLIHIEPLGSSGHQAKEKFGLTPQDVN